MHSKLVELHPGVTLAENKMLAKLPRADVAKLGCKTSKVHLIQREDILVFEEQLDKQLRKVGQL